MGRGGREVREGRVGWEVRESKEGRVDRGGMQLSKMEIERNQRCLTRD